MPVGANTRQTKAAPEIACTGQFAAMAGVTDRAARKALCEASQGKPWRGHHLPVVPLDGHGALPKRRGELRRLRGQGNACLRAPYGREPVARAASGRWQDGDRLGRGGNDLHPTRHQTVCARGLIAACAISHKPSGFRGTVPAA